MKSIGWLLSRIKASRAAAETQEIRIPVKLMFDQEAQNWHFRVPSLHVVGGAETEEEAIQELMEAIAFALETPDEETPGDQQQTFVRAEVHHPPTHGLALSV